MEIKYFDLFQQTKEKGEELIIAQKDLERFGKTKEFKLDEFLKKPINVFNNIRHLPN